MGLDIRADLSAEDVIELLDLEPLPGEGGFFRQTYRDDYSTAIYYLMTPTQFSAMHRLSRTEVSHHLAGAPAHLLLMYPDRSVEEPVVGPDLSAGHRPQVVKRAGVWQGNRTLGAWTLLGTTMAPGWDWSCFELGDRAALLREWPGVTERIVELTR